MPETERTKGVMSSSALRKATPFAGRAAGSSAFARAMFSLLPSSSIWLTPTLVTMPQSGFTNEQSPSIWPRPRIPISTMTMSISAWAASNVLGTPSSLF